MPCLCLETIFTVNLKQKSLMIALYFFSNKKKYNKIESIDWESCSKVLTGKAVRTC